MVTEMIIWTRCNKHPQEAKDTCTRCKTAADVNQRQAQRLLDAGWTKAQVNASYGRGDWQ